jgi:hypothetical protein
VQTPPDIRSVLLDVIARAQAGSSNLQSRSVLSQAADELGFRGNNNFEQALLTQFHDLFRTGYAAWGFNISNPDPPFFHLTAQGRSTLANFSGDPGNPDGYLKRVASMGALNPVAESYLKEAVSCYVGALHKAGAVMVGAAAESLILEMSETASTKMKAIGQNPPKDLDDWRIARVLAGLKVAIDQNRGQMPKKLKEIYEANWSAFTQQIRSVRNDAGHPVSIEPVTPDTVHASLLIFPELVKLAKELQQWISSWI